MAYTKEQIETILNRLSSVINISDEMFDKAENEYSSLGKWIENRIIEDNLDYKVSIYPQGSFALGTVVRPISDEDDYDLDLVCEVFNCENLSADELKNKVVKPWLEGYKKPLNDLEEKRRCWHVEYEDVPNFHMDVIPAMPRYPTKDESTMINITDKDVARIPIYDYLGSNPKGYMNWFFRKCLQRRDVYYEGEIRQNEIAEQEDLKQNKNKKCLQKAVQILKRHRDLMFEDNMDDAPISIIITTLAAQLYEGQDSLFDTLDSFSHGVEDYLNAHRKEDGSYSIPNPSYDGEDFADKWTEHPERQEAFFSWVNQLKIDLNSEVLKSRDRVLMGNALKESFGSISVSHVFESLGKEEADSVFAGKNKVDTLTGNLVEKGTVDVPQTRHYG